MWNGCLELRIFENAPKALLGNLRKARCWDMNPVTPFLRYKVNGKDAAASRVRETEILSDVDFCRRLLNAGVRGIRMANTMIVEKTWCGLSPAVTPCE